MRLESPLLLLLLVPLGLLLAWSLHRLRVAPPALRFPTLAHVRAARPSMMGRFADLPRWLQGAAVILMVAALARPQIEDAEELTGEGADFVIALDMSGSMNALDMTSERILEYHRAGREPPNRFEAARETLEAFIRSRSQDRIGLVIFSDRAWVKFPLTLDRDAMLRILDGLVLDDRTRSGTGNCTNQCTIPGEATAIGDALARAYKRLEDSSTRSRNIILITDGDNNAGTAAPEEVARFIGQQSPDRPVRIWTFLVGTGLQTFMPAFNQFANRPLRTPEGFQVYEQLAEPFPVNTALLQEIADLTGGSFFEAASEADFRKHFQDLEKTEFVQPASTRWREAFMPFLAAGFFLFLLGEVLGLTVWRRWP
jgi:Ca-activated chloride channel family protein